MNINQRIAELGAGGLPRYNNKVNELIEAVNWLMGMRSDSGIPISEGGRGPIIPTGGISTTPATPWATDPDGNAAGWTKLTCFNLSLDEAFDVWVWTGQTATNVRNIPWYFDPSGNQAGWIICPSNTFWGTGQCSTGTTCTNYINANAYTNGPGVGPSPIVAPFHCGTIVPPNSCTPRFIINALPAPGSTGGGGGPVIGITNGLQTSGQTDTLTWSFTVTYDGLTVISASAVELVTAGHTLYFGLPPAGWLWDPSGIPGYGHGSNQWIYPFNGAVSSNTSPQIVETFTFSYANSGITTCGYEFGTWNSNHVVFMTG